jgi:hypothetical protein
MTMNSFNKNLLTALFSLSAAFGMQTANASATAQATIDWSSFNVQIVDLSGGLNTPVFNWLSQEGSGYSYAVTYSPYNGLQTVTPTASDFSTALSANATTARAQSSSLRDTTVLQATAAASGTNNGFSDPGGYAQANFQNYGTFELTGKGYALFTLDWKLSTIGGSEIEGSTDGSTASTSIEVNYGSSSGSGRFYFEKSFNSWDSVTNLNGTVGWAVYNDGVNDLTGSLNSNVFAAAVFEVHPIPIPAAVWLFGSGLMGWLGFLRRKPNLTQSV